LTETLLGNKVVAIAAGHKKHKKVKKVKRVLVIGRATTTLAAGTHRTVAVKLNGKGAALLRRSAERQSPLVAVVKPPPRVARRTRPGARIRSPAKMP
jgi:hypothetical protein